MHAENVAGFFLRILREIIRQQKFPSGQNQIAETLPATKTISTNLTDVQSGERLDALPPIRLNV